MIYDAHCLSCGNVKEFYSDRAVFENKDTFIRIRHLHKRTGFICDGVCLFGLGVQFQVDLGLYGEQS